MWFGGALACTIAPSCPCNPQLCFICRIPIATALLTNGGLTSDQLGGLASCNATALVGENNDVCNLRELVQPLPPAAASPPNTTVDPAPAPPSTILTPPNVQPLITPTAPAANPMPGITTPAPATKDSTLIPIPDVASTPNGSGLSAGIRLVSTAFPARVGGTLGAATHRLHSYLQPGPVRWAEQRAALLQLLGCLGWEQQDELGGSRSVLLLCELRPFTVRAATSLQFTSNMAAQTAAHQRYVLDALSRPPASPGTLRAARPAGAQAALELPAGGKPLQGDALVPLCQRVPAAGGHGISLAGPEVSSQP